MLSIVVLYMKLVLFNLYSICRASALTGFTREISFLQGMRFRDAIQKKITYIWKLSLSPLTPLSLRQFSEHFCSEYW